MKNKNEKAYSKMKELANVLMDNNIKFTFKGIYIVLSKSDTVGYGQYENKILYDYYNDDTFNFFYVYKGYPQLVSFSDIQKLINFIKRYESEITCKYL